jgi:capsular exopolysaccharide synthesis family protein
MEPSVRFPTGDAAQGAALGEVVAILRRHLLIAAGAVALATAAGAALAWRLPPVYQATALIQVEERAPVAGLGHLQLLAGAGGTAVGTEMEVLRSRTLAREVVDSLHLRIELASPRGVPRAGAFRVAALAADAPAAEYRLSADGRGGWAAEEVQGAAAVGAFAAGQPVRLPGVELRMHAGAARHAELRVRVHSTDDALARVTGSLDVQRTGRDASVLRVRFRAGDPEVARDVPNALAARFVALRRDVQKTEARSTAAFLREQLDTLTHQLADAEEALRRFRERSGVVDLQVEGSTQVAHLAEVQAQRDLLRAEHTSLAALLGEAARAAAEQAPGAPSPFRRLAAFPTLMRNQTTADYLASLSRLEERRADLLTRRLPTDEEVVRLTLRIEEVEGHVRSVAETYLSAVGGQIAAMEATLGEYRGRLDRIPAAEVELARLSRRPRVLSEIYGLLQTRLKEAEIAQAVDDANVRVIDAAELPRRPVAPRRGLIVAASLLLGGLLAFGVAYARELSDETVHTRGDLELAAGGVPVLTLVPRLPPRPRGVGAGDAGPRRLPAAGPADLPRGEGTATPAPGALTAAVRPDAAAALLVDGAGGLDPLSDAYDWLHTSILFSRPEREVKTLVVTSALPGDGKTTTALNFAVTLAQRGLRVLLVDADLRRGGLGSVVSATPGAGLAEVLVGSAALKDTIRCAEAGNGSTFFYLPRGGLPRHPQQLLRTARMASLLRWSAGQFDRVIVDTPPLNLVADAALIGSAADGVILVARAGVTPFGALAHVAEHLRRARMPLLGTVMNDVDFRRESRYDRGYRWHGYGRAYYAAEREVVV